MSWSWSLSDLFQVSSPGSWSRLTLALLLASQAQWLACTASAAAAATDATPVANAPSVSADQLSIKLEQQPWTGDLPGMINRRVIRVLVPYSRTLYFVDLGGTQRGMSYDFMRAFEDELNSRLERGTLRVHVVFIPVARAQLLPLLIAGQGDVAAANLTITPQRLQSVDFTTPVAHDVKELIVTGPGAPPLATLDDLAGKEIYVSRATSYYDSLVALNQRFIARGLAPLRLREAPGHFETEDILEMVNAGLVKIAVADGYIGRLWRQVYPRITLRDDLVVHQNGDIAFAIRKDSPQLKAQLDAFTRTHGERVAAYRIGRETVQYVANIYKYYIAYTLVQDDVAHGLQMQR
jgi:membrane-bound lytic murein transglycosylase MltF